MIIGKQNKNWQHAFNAQDHRIYAKTAGPINYALLDGYRHEFGSLFIALEDPEFQDLPRCGKNAAYSASRHVR